jgi:hypothetical protein
MQKPKCKLCGVPHWLTEPHQFSGPAPKPETRLAPTLQAKATPIATLKADVAAIQAKPKGGRPKIKPRSADETKAAARERVKAWRAKQKAPQSA